MNEVKNSLKWLGFYYLLLAINIILYADVIPSKFPTANISSIYLLILSTCLILRYHFIVSGQQKLKKTMLYISFMVYLFIFLRCVKYSVFGSVFVLGRYMWYLYYVPMLFMPILLFFVSHLVFAKDEKHVFKKYAWVAVVTSLLVLFVLTNDLHQQVFSFKPNFEDWDSDYSREWGFVVVTAWQYILYLVSVVTLIAKCSVAKIKNAAWVISVPFVIYVVIMVLQRISSVPIGFPETLSFMVVGVLECLIQLGLIPINKNYNKLLQITSLPVLITDSSKNVVYKSNTSEDLEVVKEHMVLKSTDIPGGYAFWQNDVTKLDELNEKLAEVNEQLSEEAEFNRLQNELKEKQIKIEQQTIIYDDIAKATEAQSMAIKNIAQEAMITTDVDLKDKYRKHIMLLGAYIKRYSNLTLIARENEMISAGEIGLSVAEILRYLNNYGIPAELISNVDGSVNADKALSVFNSFFELIENNLESLLGVYVNLSSKEDYIVFKLTLENILESSFEDAIFEYEDNIGYATFFLPKGGDAL